MTIKLVTTRAMAIIAVALAAMAMPAFAQQSTMDALKAKIQADKKLVVAANMELTDAEAAKFWPVYDAYQADLQKANERILSLIKTYADVYKSTAPGDGQVLKLVDERIAIEEGEVQRDRSYIPKLSDALPPNKVFRYLQLESKIRAIIRYELADRIPLIN
jgi:hypothetical protein